MEVFIVSFAARRCAADVTSSKASVAPLAWDESSYLTLAVRFAAGNYNR